MHTLSYVAYLAYFDLPCLYDLLDLAAHEYDEDEHDHNRNEQPTGQDQEQERQLSTSITRNISSRRSNHTLCDCHNSLDDLSLLNLLLGL